MNNHTHRYRFSAPLAEGGASGVMWWAGFKQRDVRRTKGRQLEAEVPLDSTSKEEPGFHGDLWMEKKDKSSSEQSTVFEA